jgi:ElaB/YqjD/DUF883 family membrane-anchored ribosome-binding protein
VPGEDPAAKRVEEIRAQIVADRLELAGTVQKLAHKADVKSRLREQVAEGAEALKVTSDQLGERLRELRPRLEEAREFLRRQPVVPIAVGAAAFVILVFALRRAGDQ